MLQPPGSILTHSTPVINYGRITLIVERPRFYPTSFPFFLLVCRLALNSQSHSGNDSGYTPLRQRQKWVTIRAKKKKIPRMSGRDRPADFFVAIDEAPISDFAVPDALSRLFSRDGLRPSVALPSRLVIEARRSPSFTESEQRVFGLVPAGLTSKRIEMAVANADCFISNRTPGTTAVCRADNKVVVLSTRKSFSSSHENRP